MISIIIPLYNKEQSVLRAVRSVLGQSFTTFELIIVNDGSTDRSAILINDVRDPRMRLIHQTNQGVSAARNRGIAEAKYDLLAFLDADDEWHPDFLRRMIQMVEMYPDSNWWGASYTPLRAVDREDFIARGIGDREAQLIDYFKVSTKALIIHISSVVFRRKKLQSIGGFPFGVRFGEDQDVFCRFARNEQLPYLPEALSFYFTDSENRACQNRSIQEMPPFFRENEPLMMSNHLYDSQDYWIKEYLIERYLNEVSLCSQQSGFKKQAKAWLSLCSETKLQRSRYLKGFAYLVLPSGFNRQLVGVVKALKARRARS